MNYWEKKRLNFWEKADRFPPAICRLLAKHSRSTPLSTEQLSRKTGLSPVQLLTISHQLDWRGVDLPTMKKFLDACGVDFENARQIKRITVYLKGRTCRGHFFPPRFDYLRKSPEWKPLFEPLLNRLFPHSLP